MSEVMMLERRLSPWLVFVAVGLGLPGCSDDGKGSFTRGGDLIITVRPNPVTFGSVVTGAHQEQVVTIRHDGASGTLVLRDVRFESASSELRIEQPGKLSLEPGESTTMLVLYDPVDTAQDNGRIYIATNVPDQAAGNLTVQVPVQT